MIGDFEKVLEYATVAHRGQKDKQGEDYIGHPMRIAANLKSDEAKIVALLHDVAEDCEGYSVKRISTDLGLNENQTRALSLLCHDKDEDYQAYVKRIGTDPLARQVKIADLTDNMDVRRYRRPMNDSDLERMNRYIKAYNFLVSL